MFPSRGEPGASLADRRVERPRKGGERDRRDEHQRTAEATTLLDELRDADVEELLDGDVPRRSWRGRWGHRLRPTSPELVEPEHRYEHGERDERPDRRVLCGGPFFELPSRFRVALGLGARCV